MKRTIILRLIVLLVALMAGGAVASAYDFEEGGIFYNLNEDGAIVTVTFETTNYNSYSGDVVIPNFVTHDGTTYTVTAIGEYAFMQSPDLVGIVISDSVNTVGRHAFRNCTGLRNVTIGKSVTSLRGKYGSNRYFPVFTGCDSITSLTWNAVNCADNGNMGTTNIEQVAIGEDVQVIPDRFAYKSQITEVVIPNSVTTIGGSAFENCYYLVNATLGYSVTSIGGSVFANCTLLESIDIPDAVTSIGGSAFSDCCSLTHITLGNSVTTIGGSAFANCYRIERIDIPNSVTTIGDNAFYCCSGLTSLDIPNSVTSIGNEAFSDCYGLSEVTMGNSVTAIGAGAFSCCNKIEEITIPNSVTHIDAGAFYGCNNLSKVNITSLEAWCDIDFGQIWVENYNYYGYYDYDYTSNPLYYAHHLYLNGEEITELVIPESITIIKYLAFIGGSGFTRLTIGDNVTAIRDRAFKECAGLTNVTLGNSIFIIYGDAFYGCTSLTSLTIGKSVTYLSNMIGKCPNLTSLSVESGNPVFDSRDNCNAIIETATNTLVVGCPTTVIPNTVTAIGDNAFNYCDGLTSLAIPNSVTTIGCWSFYGCKDLTTIHIPNSVTSIGVEKNYYVHNNDTTVYYNYYNPFERCINLKSLSVESGNPVYDSRDNCNAVIETASNTLKFGCQSTVIPNTVTAIGDNAFYWCIYLTSIEIPNSVTSIGDNAFYYCGGLTSLDIPNSVTSIGDYAFIECWRLTNLSLGNSVSFIGSCAFYGCWHLTSVVIPNSVVTDTNSSVEMGWFWGCSELEKVTIGSGITGLYVTFWECPKITSVTCLATTPPRWFIGQNEQKERIYPFDLKILEQATLYVPAGVLDAYKTAAYWKNFQDIRALGDADGDGIVGVADVTRIIDYLQSGSGNGFDIGAADTDGDGNVTIGDVTKLIDAILNQRSV